MTPHYFLYDRLLGTGGTPLWDDVTLLEHSLVYVCPACGVAWGRLSYRAEDWLPVRAACPLHQSPLNDIGGTFLRPWQRRLEGLPPEVLTHEFLIRYARLI